MNSTPNTSFRVLGCLLACLLLALACFCAASCNGNTPASEPAASAPAESESGTSEQESVPASNVADNTQFYDEITRTLKLEKSFEGKNFLTDGIGEATVNAFTDGDTTRFRLSSGEVIIIRYYEVDTPESTSSIEKWGKAASNFTKMRLSGAEQVVLEATGPRAEHDSYGTRYLGYVWYRPAGEQTFKCLNLELTENGFTEDKGINTEDFPYYSYFHKANQFARSIQLRLYSALDDPLYSTDPVPLSLSEFEDNPDLYYDPDTDTGARVALTATLTSLYQSDSGTFTFTATDIDPETGEKHTINVYAGYTSSSSSKMKLGHRYKIIGNLQKYGGKFQISGLNYNTVYQIDDGKNTVVVQKDYYLTFDDSLPFIEQFNQTLYGDLTVTSAETEGENYKITGEAKQRTKNGYKDENSVFVIRVPLENLSEGDRNLKAGDVIRLAAYQFEEGSGNLTVFSAEPFTLVS